MTALAVIAAYPLMLVATLAGMVLTARFWGDPWQRPSKPSRRSRSSSVNLKLNWPRARP